MGIRRTLVGAQSCGGARPRSRRTVVAAVAEVAGGAGGGRRSYGGGGGGQGSMFSGGSTGQRYQLTLSAYARNLLNNVNDADFTGNLTSPYFGRANALYTGFGGGGGGGGVAVVDSAGAAWAGTI